MLACEKLLLKLLIVSKLMSLRETSLRELGWDTGLDYATVVRLIKELSKNYVLRIDGEKVYWDPADNPSTLKPWGWRLVHTPFLGSTQDAARKYGPWSIIVAEYLIQAKGRHGKTWKTGFGGLWFTISMSLPPEQAMLLPIATPVIIARTLNNLYKINAKIKWPNDIVVNGKKIAGILIEAEAFPSNFIIYVGIGINVNNDVTLKEAISLKKIVGLKPRNRVFASVIGWFSRLKKIIEDKEELLKTYLENLDTLGRKVIVETVAGEVEGIAEDVTENGSIVIKTSNGVKIFDPMAVLRLRYKEQEETKG